LHVPVVGPEFAGVQKEGDLRFGCQREPFAPMLRPLPVAGRHLARTTSATNAIDWATGASRI
jgi:hypothetical protein